jgi:hypothetical protein
VNSATSSAITCPDDPAIACTPATSFHTNMSSTPTTLNARPQKSLYARFAQGTMLRRNLLLGRLLRGGGDVGWDFAACMDSTRSVGG